MEAAVNGSPPRCVIHMWPQISTKRCPKPERSEKELFKTRYLLRIGKYFCDTCQGSQSFSFEGKSLQEVGQGWSAFFLFVGELLSFGSGEELACALCYGEMFLLKDDCLV